MILGHICTNLTKRMTFLSGNLYGVISLVIAYTFVHDLR